MSQSNLRGRQLAHNSPQNYYEALSYDSYMMDAHTYEARMSFENMMMIEINYRKMHPEYNCFMSKHLFHLTEFNF